jgi:hypothetical protein
MQAPWGTSQIPHSILAAIFYSIPYNIRYGATANKNLIVTGHMPRPETVKEVLFYNIDN